MINFSKCSLEELIRPGGFRCDCGMTHTADIRIIKIGAGVINTVPDAVRVLGAKRPMIICGPNGYKAAGTRLEAIMKYSGIPYSLHVIPYQDGKRIEPSEFATGSIVLNSDRRCDLVLGVGSGVINDLCKVIANMSRLPFMIVATAPSMDGYASHSSSMVVNNVKLTLSEKCPDAIICDTEIMADAPMRLLQAGLGDMMGKYTALCEWRLASIILGEHYCENIAQLVRSSLQKITDVSKDIKDRDLNAVQSISEGLVLSGIAMAFANMSRPASGLEHYFSHCWDMMALVRGEESDLHGIQVGIGTLLTMKLFKQLAAIRPTMDRVLSAIDSFDEAVWEANIHRVFGNAADYLIAMDSKARKNEAEARIARARRIIDNWDQIVHIINQELPEYQVIENLMEQSGMPVKPQDIGFSVDDTVDAFVYSRDTRDKYLTSSLIWDLGYMDEFARWLRTSLATEKERSCNNN